MAKILVTGGGGYVGSHACKALQAAGHIPISFDNFSTGWHDAVRFGPSEEGDLRDDARLDAVFSQHQPEAVLHLAALSDIAQSMREPDLYRHVNVVGTQHLLQNMAKHGVDKIVFSSTCAVYDSANGAGLTEDHPILPASIYGETKLAAENCLQEFEKSHGISSICLRYFNVAGADSGAELGEFHRPETHLIPRILMSGRDTKITVNGSDYDTPDGTCMRDYIHVKDLCDAHMRGLEWLMSGGNSDVFNLGNGKGFSVLEVLRAAGDITGLAVPYDFGPPRPGDCARLISGSDRAERILGWKPARSSLARMISDAWKWHQTPGYAR